MHQREQERCARDRRTAATLTDIADEIDTSRHLVDAAFIVAEEMTAGQGAELTLLLDLIGDGLKATSAEIMACAKREITDAA